MNLDQLFKNAEDVECFKAGETIFSEGTTGDTMYVVLDGEAEIRVAGESVEVVGVPEAHTRLATFRGGAHLESCLRFPGASIALQVRGPRESGNATPPRA